MYVGLFFSYTLPGGYAGHIPADSAEERAALGSKRTQKPSADRRRRKLRDNENSPVPQQPPPPSRRQLSMSTGKSCTPVSPSRSRSLSLSSRSCNVGMYVAHMNTCLDFLPLFWGEGWGESRKIEPFSNQQAYSFWWKTGTQLQPGRARLHNLNGASMRARAWMHIRESEREQVEKEGTSEAGRCFSARARVCVCMQWVTRKLEVVKRKVEKR